MALQQELLKSAVVAVLALLHLSGSALLPVASTITLAAVQAFSLLNFFVLSPPCKVAAKVDSDSCAEVAATATTSTSGARCAAGLVLAVLFARALRILGLGGPGSLCQVVIFACLAGALCYCMVALPSRGATDDCASSLSAHHNPAFWPQLEEKSDAVENRSILASLVEEYSGPSNMLSLPLLLEAED